jgi:hypothetical protein
MTGKKKDRVEVGPCVLFDVFYGDGGPRLQPQGAGGDDHRRPAPRVVSSPT